MTSDDLDAAMKEMRSGWVMNWMWAPSGQRGSQDSL